MVMPFTELGETEREKQLCGEIKNSVLDTLSFRCVLSLEGEMREKLNL